MEIKQYISYIISENCIEKQEILIAELSDFGFDGFEQKENGISATGLINSIDKAAVKSYLESQGVLFTTQTIQEQNWNALWEQSFEPIVVGKFCAVRAAFHQPIKGVQYDIIITPKMSFGTGHHATTYMMLQAMEHINFMGKTVIDFGSGTGILAILAEKSGAEKIDAIDYDEWCIENGKENMQANKCSHINMIQASGLETVLPANVILANINKHVILSTLPFMRFKLSSDGVLLISGILREDEREVINMAVRNGFSKRDIIERNGWLCICFDLT